MSRTLSGLFLVGAVNRPRKRKRNRESPKRDKKGTRKEGQVQIRKPPCLKPPRLAALDSQNVHVSFRVGMVIPREDYTSFRENLNGNRYMATGKWPKNGQRKAPRSFSHFFACFRLFSTVFALFRSLSHFLGCLFLTVFGRPFLHFLRSFSHFLGCLFLTVFGRPFWHF